jgi:hypothetical protein
LFVVVVVVVVEEENKGCRTPHGIINVVALFLAAFPFAGIGRRPVSPSLTPLMPHLRCMGSYLRPRLLDLLAEMPSRDSDRLPRGPGPLGRPEDPGSVGTPDPAFPAAVDVVDGRVLHDAKTGQQINENIAAETKLCRMEGRW